MHPVRKNLLILLLAAAVTSLGCQGRYTAGGASSLGTTTPGAVHGSQALEETSGTGGTPPGGLRGGPEGGLSER
ncbi:MAG: hypothetical protein IH614_08285 [Desulfuromonadales bacterium]|nr:hypothetical protein [Desulfuromonadales bacterium]